MSYYEMRDGVWSGGIGQGKWIDEDFMQDFDRMFDDIGYANWCITKNLMNPAAANIPPEMENAMIAMCRGNFDPFIMEKPHEVAERVKAFIDNN